MHIKALLLATAYTLVVLGIATMLTACEAAKTVYDACRGGYCR